MLLSDGRIPPVEDEDVYSASVWWRRRRWWRDAEQDREAQVLHLHAAL